MAVSSPTLSTPSTHSSRQASEAPLRTPWLWFITSPNDVKVSVFNVSDSVTKSKLDNFSCWVSLVDGIQCATYTILAGKVEVATDHGIEGKGCTQDLKVFQACVIITMLTHRHATGRHGKL